jgi:serine/threonine protein kinase
MLPWHAPPPRRRRLARAARRPRPARPRPPAPPPAPSQPQVCDFNLSRVVADEAQLANSGNPNSPGWQSPEILGGKAYGKPADVFSFGVVLWELITLRQPWRWVGGHRQQG